MAEASAGDVVVEADDDDFFEDDDDFLEEDDEVLLEEDDEVFLDDDDEVSLEDDDDEVFLEDDDEVSLEEDDEVSLEEDDEVSLEDDDEVFSEDDEDEVIDLMEDDGSGWLPDPEVVGQERFWDGTEWTDEVRPAEELDEETDEVALVEELVEDTDEVRPVEELVEEEDEDEEVVESDDEALDALMEDDGSGWMNDPVVAGQERFWDGTEWTDHVRPVEEEVEVPVRGRHALPDHVPELQRAMAAATDDIDDVEDRLSSLFERIDEKGRKKRGAEAGAAPRPVSVSRASGEQPIHEEFGATSRAGADAPMYMGREEAGPAFRAGDDDEATFAELDAALAEEAPDKPIRRFFKRRS